MHHTVRGHINHPVQLKEYFFHSQIAYLSQVDVNSVLQELGGLPGPLLNGQHPDRFHTGLQLDHSRVLILREIKRLCVNEKLIADTRVASISAAHLIIRGNVFSLTYENPHQSPQTWGGGQSVITGLPPLLVSQGFSRHCSVSCWRKTCASSAETARRAPVCAFFISLSLNFSPLPPSLSPY